MTIKKILSEIWMSELEQEIYLITLKYNEVGAGTIAKLLKKPRSTIYDYVSKMCEDNFIQATKQNSWTNYTAVEPSQLINFLEKKKKNINSLIKNIDAQKYLFKEYQNENKILPKVRLFQWIEAMEVFQSNTIFERWYFTRDIDALMLWLWRTLEQVIGNFANENQKNQKSIMIKSENALKFKETIHSIENNTHKIKFLNENITELNSDTMLINWLYIHFTYVSPMLAIEINNPTFFETQKILFESLREKL